MILSPETDLLLACTRHFAGTCGDAGVVERARRIEDWSAVMELARAHWMEPLVAWQLRTLCADLLEPSFAADVDHILRYNTARHLLLSAELIKVLGILEAERIPAVPLKGPVLAAMLCDEIPWRESCDLDLLVRRADVTRAKDALLASGCRLDSQLPAGEEQAAFHWRSQLVLVRDGVHPAVDLHWQLVRSLFPAARHFESVWERLQTTAFHDQKILALSPADNLFFLCAHAARHSWHSLRLAADVARLIHVRPDLDWDGVMNDARQSDGAMVLALGLWIVNRLLAVELPKPVLGYINAAIGAKRFARNLPQRLLTINPDQYETSPEFSLQFRLARGLWPKTRCAAAFALLPTDADGAALRLPPRLSFLHYPYRQARLAWKYGARLLRSAAAVISAPTHSPPPHAH
jgi:hypothetical protein